MLMFSINLLRETQEFHRGVLSTYERGLCAAVIYTLQDVVGGYTKKEMT